MTCTMNNLGMIPPSSNGKSYCIATKRSHVFFERVILFGPVNEVV